MLLDFRTHAKIQTRRPKERPKELSFLAAVEGGPRQTYTVPVDDHPFFTPMPVWGLPGLLRGIEPSAQFQIENKAHLFYSIPQSIRKTLDLRHGQVAEIPIPEFVVDHYRYARGIAKMAYCQAVIRYGLHRFDRLDLPDLILGKYYFVPHYVGSDPDDYPPPPMERTVVHVIDLETTALPVSGRVVIAAAVRLFANSGTDQYGTPIYRVVVGAPLWSCGG